MAVGEVRNPWVAYSIGADWEWHVKNGYQGGTDRKVRAGIPVRSAVDGYAVAVNDGLNTIVVTMNDGTGRQIVHMENKSRTGSFPRHVKVDEQIGVTGLARKNPAGKMIVRWPHIHAVVKGNRVRFEPLVFKPAGTKPPVVITPEEGEEEMIVRQIHYTDATGKLRRAMLVPGTAWFMEWSEGASVYANGFVKTFDTGSSQEVTASLFEQFKGAAAKCAAGTVTNVSTPAATPTSFVLTGAITPNKE